jgi:hypothetical protein
LAKAGAASAPTFRELLKKTNINDRAKLFEAMLPLGKEAKVLTPELLDMVTDQVYPGGFIDGNLLKMVKDCGSDGAKGLAEILRSRNNDSIAFIARQSLLGTIGEMKGEAEAKASVPILIQLLKDNTPTHPVVEYRHLILEALGEIGPPAKQAIPTVESLTKPNFNGLTAEQQKAAQNVSEVAAVTLRRLGKAEKRGD